MRVPINILTAKILQRIAFYTISLQKKTFLAWFILSETLGYRQNPSHLLARIFCFKLNVAAIGGQPHVSFLSSWHTTRCLASETVPTFRPWPWRALKPRNSTLMLWMLSMWVLRIQNKLLSCTFNVQPLQDVLKTTGKTKSNLSITRSIACPVSDHLSISTSWFELVQEFHRFSPGVWMDNHCGCQWFPSRGKFGYILVRK